MHTASAAWLLMLCLCSFKALQGVDLEKSVCVHVPSCLKAVACKQNHSHVLHCRLQDVNLESSAAAFKLLSLLPSWPRIDKMTRFPRHSAGR